jgi:hypothetical protein
MLERKKLWFKRRRFGWGWVPITTAGWLVVLAYLMAVVFFLAAFERTGSQIILYVGLIISTALLTLVCWSKGESPKWQWGNDE